MSKLEFIKLCNGERLTNNTKHKAMTTSIGFCFLDYDEYKPEYAFRFLSGVANVEMCVIFETDNKVQESVGIYSKPLSNEEYRKLSIVDMLDFSKAEAMKVDEYCITEYNKNDFKILKYCEPYQFNVFNTSDFKWVEYHD